MAGIIQKVKKNLFALGSLREKEIEELAIIKLKLENNWKNQSFKVIKCN